MRFKLDENFGPWAQELFRVRGYDCPTVRDQGLRGADDATVLQASVGEKRVLVTMDRDFGDVLAYPPEKTAGIVVIDCLGRASRALICTLIEGFLDVVSRQEIQGCLWIVEPGRIRMHEPSGTPPSKEAE
jgi:predicted nuclease of predicted toxin-antitoxin system